MSNACFRYAVIVFAGVLAGAALADDGDAVKKGKGDAAPTKFIQLVREDGELVSLQTAIVSYRLPEETQVDLIGAVHVGDRAYYDKLNKVFESYDIVLYELVAPEGTRVPAGGGGGSGHPVALIQGGMKNALNLAHQLDHIDYHVENFVHADMSPEDFRKSMEERGESLTSMFFRMMGQGIAMQTKTAQRTSDTAMIAAMLQSILGDPAGAINLKRQMAQQFEDLEGAMKMFDGPNGSVIITERNKRALDVLAKQLAEGHKKIGIFYGAGHLPDFDKRLISDFGAKRGDIEWVQAWNLRESSVNVGEKRPKSED